MTIPKCFSVNHEVVQLLPEYANCINYDSNNHFDKCMYSKLYDLMMAEHGCTGYFYQFHEKLYNHPNNSFFFCIFPLLSAMDFKSF